MTMMNELISGVYSSPRLKKLYGILKHYEMTESFFSNPIINEEINDDDFRFLAESAALLATSADDIHREIALTVATVLPKLSSSSGVIASSLLTLNRLSNFPSIPLVLKSFSDSLDSNDYKEELPIFSAFEAYVIEGIYSLNFLNQPTTLTRFQKRVTKLVQKDNAASISAPTSAGKSFIFIRLLLDTLYKNPGSTVIYIVPTRALIRQVMNDIIKTAYEYKLKNLAISCSSEIDNLTVKSNVSNVLVLTQERLYQLCASADTHKLKVNLLIIDEAQEIQHDDRGVLLEEAIKYVKRLWPDTKVLFASPLVSNPEILLKTFDYNIENHDFDRSPVVRQNIVKVLRKKGFLEIFHLENEKEDYIGKIKYRSVGSGTSKARILGEVILQLWNNQNSIVYASESLESAKVARFLYDSGDFSELNIDELNEFAEFIEDHIHKNFELANFIRCGIAFHFGKLPAIVRSGVEDLMKKGMLNIVCCTSTLLEGLNLPAKNVFVYRPTRGRGKPLEGIDFWNLAGRAGRMGTDLYGNIICIDPDSWDVNPIEQSKTQKIVPAVEKRLKSESSKVNDYIKDRTQPSGRDEYNEQIVSLLVRDRINSGKKLVESTFVTEENKHILLDIDDVVEQIIKDYIAPIEILKQNPGILPDRINSLWKFIKETSSLELLLPIFPLYPGAKKRLAKIFHLINEHLLLGKYTNKQVERLAVIGHKWMAGNPLSELIHYGLDSNAKPSKITKHVKDVMDTLESDIRYTFVKYTQLYTQLLKYHLRDLDISEEIVSIVPISSYLEYGACTIPPLTFMSLGLSRAAAISLAKEFGNRPNVSKDDCTNWLARKDIESLNIPAFLKREALNVQSGLM